MNQVLHTDLSNEIVKKVCNLAFPEYKGRKIRIAYNVKKLSLRSFWDGGSKSAFVIIRLQDMKRLPAPTSHPVFDRVQGVDDFIIPEGYIVIEHIIFQGKDLGLRIHVPGEFGLLPETTEEPELTKIQITVLYMLSGLNSAGRKDALARYHFPKKLYVKITEELQNLGYCKINKAGAISITTEGKNYFSMKGKFPSQLSGGLYSWSGCYDWKTRRFNGYAKEVLKEYQEKYNLFEIPVEG